MLDHDLLLEPGAEIHGDANVAKGENFDPKEYVALAEDAARCADHAKETGASLATLFEAVRRLAGSNQVVIELAELGERLADELAETMEDTRTRFLLEGERHDQ